ncbi:hypothetical protein CpCAPMI03_00654 [Corynebacterium pseudotuberculosis]|nr:Hypothetical protein CpATCC19410_0678 [Corynebacterium pseudotuberculosis]QBB90648.1 hypothetical protein CpCR07_0656 [Corynebacterium pseudotuberculosis]QBB92753.1 hypothetical protein CpCAPNAT1_00653 [Corynebacterium pseudotuberculosis]QBB94860.1 hypothetical protein CpCAPMI03_00654 [Corynebacterium pseudotuberculosis]QBG65559.1 Hypothetical protein CpCAP8W_0658 [Corynebacterium pseudotuberculosis]
MISLGNQCTRKNFLFLHNKMVDPCSIREKENGHPQWSAR